ncbi:MAG: hypothetical protein LBH59_08620 [Planctomycetaceae bacterium]|jgi:endonuclease III|nr:hypothetical protein [Planctomycetaceae bacterium]
MNVEMKVNDNTDRFITSVNISWKVHHRIRELTGFDHGGFSRFVEASLNSFLPLVEMYYSNHKHEKKSRQVFLALQEKTDYISEYEAIGREIIKEFIKRKKGGFHNGK